MIIQAKDRHIDCPCCGTEYSALDEPAEVRRIEEKSKDRDALEKRVTKLEGELRKIIEEVNLFERQFKQSEYTYVDQARDLFDMLIKQAEQAVGA